MHMSNVFLMCAAGLTKAELFRLVSGEVEVAAPSIARDSMCVLISVIDDN